MTTLPGKFESFDVSALGLPFTLEFIGAKCFLSTSIHIKITVLITENPSYGFWLKENIQKFFTGEIYEEDFPCKEMYKTLLEKRLILLKTLHTLQERRLKRSSSSIFTKPLNY